MKLKRSLVISGGTVIAAVSAGGAVWWTASPVTAGDGAAHASAVLHDGSGSEVGFARFTEDAAGRVHVNVHVDGMTPGLHGIHVHAVGDCSSGSTPFSGAGSHHNPSQPPRLHGQHAGDLPNLVVNGAGQGQLTTTFEQFTLAGPAAILDANGSALVVHAMPDDLVTDPAGNSGTRIACGVIQSA